LPENNLTGNKKASLIISVYKKTFELDLILNALTIQSFNEFEVIIAEDGQDAGMKILMDEWTAKNKFPVKHLIQKDKGFRKNKILNEAIRNTYTDYLIFIDGDCIPHSNFIRAHVESRESGTVLCGRRVNLTKSISQKITKEIILSKDYEKVKLSEVIYSSLNKGKADFNFNIEEAFVYKNKTLRKVLTNKDEHILGCNFSIEKAQLEKINGFDENYEGPGLGEDSDIEYRLRLIDAKFKSVRNLAIQYHLYHPKTIEEPVNMKYFNEVKKQNEYFCKNGLVKI